MPHRTAAHHRRTHPSPSVGRVHGASAEHRNPRSPVTATGGHAYCGLVPKSKVRRKSRGHTRRTSATWRQAAAISSRDPSGLPDVLFPADVTGSSRPEFVGDELDFVVASPEAMELKRVTLRFERRWATTAALDAWGFDTSKALAAHIRVQRSGAWSLDMRTAVSPLNASQALLLLEIVEVLVPPNSVALTAAGTMPDGFSTLERRAAPEPPERLADATRFLARLEAYIGESIALPDVFTEESYEDLRVAAALLSGDTVQGTWDQVKWPMTAAQARDLASGPLSEGAADLDLTRSWTVDLGDGRRYELHPVLAHLNSVRVSAWPETDGLADDAPVAVVLEPAERRACPVFAPQPGHGACRCPRRQGNDGRRPANFCVGGCLRRSSSSLEEPAEPAPALAKAAARLRVIRT